MKDAIAILKILLEMAEAQEAPVFEDPMATKYAKDLDDTYKEAIQDCIEMLEKALDNPVVRGVG